MSTTKKSFLREFSSSPEVRYLIRNRQILYIVLIPLLLSPLPIAVQDRAAYCAYIMLIMALYWMLECLPTPITSLLPVVFFPLFGITSSKCVTQIYFNDIQMLFWGALAVASGIETSGLHKKLALMIMMLFGSDPKWLLLGIMTATGFLSLWIQNTAAASMMLPIVVALVKQLANYNKAFSTGKPLTVKVAPKEEPSVDVIEMNNVVEEDSDKVENEQVNTDELPNTKAAQNLMKGFCLSIAYSASVGGAGSLVGTTPNLILKGYVDDKYQGKGGLNFITYLLFAAPVALLIILAMWMVQCLIWLPFSEIFTFKKKAQTQKVILGKKKMNPLDLEIRKRYQELGPFNWEQISTGILFLLLVLFWLTRDLFFVPGWESLFGGKKYVSDTTPAILIVILMFVWPRKNIFMMKDYEHLIGWSDLKNFPWDVILLGGGSLAVAYGFEKSGLSTWLSTILADVIPAQREIALIVIILFNQVGTEFTSNTSMASIFIPIADELARQSGVNPIYYLLPLTFCVSIAFLFPVSTPPNAIIFGSGYVKITDMVKAGVALKFVGVLILYAASNIWLDPIFSENIGALFNNATSANNQSTPVCEC